MIHSNPHSNPQRHFERVSNPVDPPTGYVFQWSLNNCVTYFCLPIFYLKNMLKIVLKNQNPIYCIALYYNIFLFLHFGYENDFCELNCKDYYIFRRKVGIILFFQTKSIER